MAPAWHTNPSAWSTAYRHAEGCEAPRLLRISWASNFEQGRAPGKTFCPWAVMLAHLGQPEGSRPQAQRCSGRRRALPAACPATWCMAESVSAHTPARRGRCVPAGYIHLRIVSRYSLVKQLRPCAAASSRPHRPVTMTYSKRDPSAHQPDTPLLPTQVCLLTSSAHSPRCHSLRMDHRLRLKHHSREEFPRALSSRQ